MQHAIWARHYRGDAFVHYLYRVKSTAPSQGAQSAPGSQSSLREANRLRVIDALHDNGALTQVEIAQSTGLSPATVSNVVKELDAGRAVGLSPSVRNGRRAVLVSLMTPDGLLAGITFGDRDVRIAIGTSVEDVVGRQRLPLPANHSADEGLQRASRLLVDLVERAGKSMDQIAAIALGLPAPIDSVTGQVGSEGILPGWRGVDVATEMRSLTSAPVVLDNTANLAALGELKVGRLQGVQNALFIKASYGVGAGLILNGSLFRGSAGTAGEIGHVTIDENGPICRCGNRGCLDTYVGSAAILAAVAHSHGPMTLRDVINLAADGDLGCRRVFEDCGRHLGVAVAGVVNLINPEVVMLGGQLRKVGDILLGPMRESIDRRAIPSAAASVTLVQSALGEEADVLGALVTAAQSRSKHNDLEFKS
ncbi:MAG: ROK family transcriptional regulator [Antricoccus sp.]